MKIIQKNKNTLFSLMFIGILVNFNSHFNDILFFFNEDHKGMGLINLIRATSLYLISFFILIFFILDIKFIKNNTLNAFYLFIFIQLISFLMIRDIVNEQGEIYFWLNYFLVISFFYCLFSIDNSKLYEYFFYIFFIFLLIVSLVLLSKLYGNIFTSKASSFYFSYFVSSESLFLNQGVPRVTGIARILALIIILNVMIFMYSKYKTTAFITLLFFCSSLFLTQSRASLLGVIILGIFMCFSDKNYKLLKKINFFIFILLFSFSFQFIILEIKKIINYEKTVSTQEKIIQKPQNLEIIYPNLNGICKIKCFGVEDIIVELGLTFGDKNRNQRYGEQNKRRIEEYNDCVDISINPSNTLCNKIPKDEIDIFLKDPTEWLQKRDIFFHKMTQEEWYEERKKNNQEINNEIRLIEDFSSSGRVGDWKKLLILSMAKPLFGYGFMSDRFLINETASSAYIYSLISSGIFGLILFLSIIFFALKNCLKLIFKYKIFNEKNNIILKTCLLANVFITGRTIIENSFSTYNLDLVIFILSFLIIEKYIKNKEAVGKL